MELEKIKTYLGFAIKSGKIIFGSDNLFASSRKPSLVLICSSQNDKVSNKVIDFCNSNKIQVIKLKNVLLFDLLNRNCKVLGIVDSNLSMAIMNEFQNGK